MVAINPAFADSEYRAIVSCKHLESYMMLESCFADTGLKVTANGATKLYKAYDLRSAGTMYAKGLEIELPSKFSIAAQNSANNLVLSVIIKNRSNDVVFSDETGNWGVIRVSN